MLGMQTSLVLMLLGVAVCWAGKGDIVCKRGKLSKKINVGEGDSYVFKTQAGRTYAPNTKCVATYKKKASCPEMRFSCSEFNVNNKRKTCKGKDVMQIQADGKKTLYCNKNGPAVSTTGKKLKVSFLSDRRKQSSGAVCTLECVSLVETTIPPPTEIPGLSITENGTTFVETSSYNPSTNTLRVNVPPHNNYGQTDFLLDGNLGQTVMKSNGLCLLSSHGKLDVREMAEKLQQMEKSEEDEFSTEYVVKIRKTRVGNQERKKLMGEANEFCKEEGIIRTEDKSVEKEVFEGLAGGKVVTIDSTDYVNSEDQCWLKEACTNPGPNACGYGWPNPAGGGISAHQLSATVVCVECCVETLPGCCRKMFPDFCICQDITHKNVLMDCILGNTTHEIDYRDPSGTVVHQTLNFNAFNPEGNPRALKLQVHAHDNFQDMTMIMHAAASGYWHHATLKNNMLLKFGARCHILDLPSDVFPIDIGVNFLETESGNFILNQEDQIISTNTLIVDGTIKLGTLHPDIQKLCDTSEVVRSRMVPANQTYMEVSTFKLTPGKEIAPSGLMMTSCCSQLMNRVAHF